MTVTAIATPMFDLANEIIRDGGATWHAYRPAPMDGFMVSAPNHERRIPLAEFNSTEVEMYMRDKQNITYRYDDLFYGAWIDGGHVYLDLSYWVATRTVAIQLGKIAKQLAIWDVLNGAEIRL
ncbi:hypothetical protein [Actinomadura sp. WMMB 499]|uniref:hypothetical protein n=1 Tax=Actinomadura sp. WMMB 499 TaxID=1219491 RepID=UPI0012483AFC|nr:hypothetical protein [Actinomadura sp. WMMB 499]QFG25417.1 hypothetical protein F7P10_33935 [Actinomadura sp. WMMB 499]